MNVKLKRLLQRPIVLCKREREKTADGFAKTAATSDCVFRHDITTKLPADTNDQFHEE